MPREIISEKLLEKKGVAAVTDVGGLSIKLYGLTFTGLPDRLNLLPGAKVCFAEFKTTGKGLSPRQKIVFPMLEKMGFRVWIVSDNDTLALFKKSLI
jgi:hypothetical protein